MVCCMKMVCRFYFIYFFNTAATIDFYKNKYLFKTFKSRKDKNMSVAVQGLTCPTEGKGWQNILNSVTYSPCWKRNLITDTGFGWTGAKITSPVIS